MRRRGKRRKLVDALLIYENEVDRIVKHVTNGDYGETFSYLEKIDLLSSRIDHTDHLLNYIARLRTEFKRKRNFMAQLNEMGF